MFRRKDKIPNEFLDMTLEEFEEKLVHVDKLVEEGYALDENQKMIIEALRQAIKKSKANRGGL